MLTLDFTASDELFMAQYEARAALFIVYQRWEIDELRDWAMDEWLDHEL